MFDPEEFVKCKDFVYFAKTYLKIIHPIQGVIPFKLHGYQEKLIDFCNNKRFIIAKKFRQSGITTLVIFWLLWKCVFFNDQSIFVVSRTDRESVHLGKLVDLAVKEIKGWLKPHFLKCNQHEKIFEETGSSIFFGTATRCIGKSLTSIFIDEAAFIPDMDEFWKSMYPTLATGGSCIVASTVNGIDNWFFQTWFDSIEGKNSFCPVEINYYEHPDYNNQIWVEKMKKKLGERGWRQEVLGEFLVEDVEETERMANDFAGSLNNVELVQKIRHLMLKTYNVEERAFLLEVIKRLSNMS